MHALTRDECESTRGDREASDDMHALTRDDRPLTDAVNLSARVRREPTADAHASPGSGSSAIALLHEAATTVRLVPAQVTTMADDDHEATGSEKQASSD